MKKIFVKGEELLVNLGASPIYHSGSRNTSLAVNVSYYSDEAEITNAKLVLYSRETLEENIGEVTKRKTISFSGVITTDKKQFHHFTGLCNRIENSKDYFDHCCLLVDENTDIFTSKISREEFILRAKKYCENRNISVDENGYVASEDFLNPFENAPKNNDYFGEILKNNIKGRKDIVIYPKISKGYFPLLWFKEPDLGNKSEETAFGRFITEYEIKIYPMEEVFTYLKDELVEV